LLRKIRRGIRWIFALDALQMQVIRPLSLLLDEIKRLERKRLRNGDGTFTKDKIVIQRSAAPHLIAAIEKSLQEVRTKIHERCRDNDLARPIKKRVELYLEVAQEAMAADDWGLAKTNLQNASRCM